MRFIYFFFELLAGGLFGRIVICGGKRHGRGPCKKGVRETIGLISAQIMCEAGFSKMRVCGTIKAIYNLSEFFSMPLFANLMSHPLYIANMTALPSNSR